MNFVTYIYDNFVNSILLHTIILMSSKELYKRFVSVCKKWPRDETKVGRDYGDYIREQFKAEFPHAEQSQVKNIQALESSISSLEKLANNIYFNENPLKRSSASGMEAWACRVAVSTEGLRAIQEQEEATLVKRLKQALNIKLIKEDSFKSDVNKTIAAPKASKENQ